jgi:hypothetical protein
MQTEKKMEQKFNASVEQVFALLTAPKWLEARSLAMGELSAKVKAKKTAKGVNVTMDRRLHRDLPTLIAKVLPADSDVHFEEVWTRDDDGYVGTWTMEILGQPVKATAEFSLSPSGKGCVYAIQHKASCSIAFVGGAVAKFAQGEIETATQAEMDYLAQALR